MTKKSNPEDNAFRIIFVSKHGARGQPVRVVMNNDKNRKWSYQANYMMGIHICIDFFCYVGDEPPDTEELISHYILLIRPNRADRRKVVPK